MAIDAGFRHIDAAYVYENEVEVGKALREKIADSTVKREDLFYTTKVLWASDRRSLSEHVGYLEKKQIQNKNSELGSSNLFITWYCKVSL